MTILLLLGSNFHSAVKQIEQHIPWYLSKYANVVCFEYPRFSKLPQLASGALPLIERLEDRLTVLHTVGLLPGGRSVFLINKINHALNTLLFQSVFKRHFDIVVSFTPEFALLAPSIKADKIVYHILDDYESLPWWGSRKSSRDQFHHMQDQTIKLAHTVITVSPSLYNKCKRFHKNVHLFPTPAYLAYYRNSKRLSTPQDIMDLPRPIIGFAGSATFEGKLDIHLLRDILKKYPSYSIIFIGEYSPVIREKIGYFTNCYFLGIKKLEDLPRYLSSFDVCLVPYMINSYGTAAYPVKIMEYLSLGKPVVSTALPSIKDLAYTNLIYWSRNQDEFIRNVKRALREGMRDKKLVQARIREGLKNDWSVRIREYMKIIAS